MKPVLGYYDNGQLQYEIWFVDGKCRRLDGPAYRSWFKTGQLEIEEWRVDNKYHRLDGPACQCWHENGQLGYEDWYFNGIRYKKEEHPFILFCKEHSLSEIYEEWPNDMKFLFEVIYK